MKTIHALPRQYRLRMCGLTALCGLAASALFAQSPLPRIQSQITPSQMTPLRGSQHPLALPQYDAGRVPTGTRLNGITLYFNRSAAQEADLQALLKAQQDPSSPQFHKWLTPAQFGARFGMAPSDIDRVQAWLEQEGFSIDSVMHSRTAIRFSGSVAQVENAFATQMHYYNVQGEKHMAPSTALSVPSAIAGVVAGVRNLDDFRPQPQMVRPRPGFTGSQGDVYFAPGDIDTVYDINPLLQGGVDGTGQTIAIMGQSYIEVGDIEAFQTAAGLPVKDPNLVIIPGSGTDGSSAIHSGDEAESDLDLEWSGAIAPGANIVFVYPGNNTNYGVYDSAQYAVDNMIGNIISLSYSSCESVLRQTDLNTLEGIFSQAAAQGQTVMAASGDQGSTACIQGYGNSGLTQAQQQALAVNYPASSAYVTGVGGTEIDMSKYGGSNSAYWTQSSGTDVINSAKQYIPEIVWNDDQAPSYFSASGGGTSALVARPSWQSGVPGIPSGSMRLVPDIALYSSPGAPGYLYCSSDSKAAWDTKNGQQSSCTSGFRDSSSGLLTFAGGTSFATPIFAGMMALINQNANYVSGSGEVNANLYKLASVSATYSAVFHDVTQGNNDCNVGSTACGASQGKGFSAGVGYDEATGLGSFDVAKLAAAFPANTGTGATLLATTTTVVPANPTPNSGDSDVFTITVSSVASGGATPTGTVDLQIDGGTQFGGTTLSKQALTNGTFQYTANFTASGTHQVIAQYSGDATYAASTGIGEISIAAATGKGSFTMKASNVTVSQGSSGSSTITVTPSGGYTGTVNLTLDFGSSDSTLGNLCFSFTTMDNSGTGSVSVPGANAVTTQLSLDTNASDCVSTTGGMVPGKGQFRRFAAVSRLHAGNQKPSRPQDNRLPLGFAFAGLLFAGILGRHSRKLRGLACILALAVVGMALSACGSSNGVNSGPQDPPKGTYTGTITGTDSVTSTITTTANFTFTIN